MQRPPDKQSRGASRELFWKGLFSSGEFAWGLRMRAGDGKAFFAPQDRSGALLDEKRRWLDSRPDRRISGYCEPSVGVRLGAKKT